MAFGEAVELEVPDVVFEPLDPFESEIRICRTRDAHLPVIVGRLILPGDADIFLGGGEDPQVPVMADLLHVLGQSPGEDVEIVEVIVFALLEVFGQGLAHLFGRLGEDVRLVEVEPDAVDDRGLRVLVEFRGIGAGGKEHEECRGEQHCRQHDYYERHF